MTLKREYTDAKGDVHKEFTDGRSEIYHKGPHDPDQRFMEVTDGADEVVKRRRFIPWTGNKPIETTLMTRDDPEETAGTPGIDDLEEG